VKKTILIFTLLVLILSCEKPDNTCNCNNPLSDLTWLRDLKDSMVNCHCEISIIQASYMKQTVFYLGMTDPLCDGIFYVELFNCKGVIVKSYTNFNEFDNEVIYEKVLYRCKTAK